MLWQSFAKCLKAVFAKLFRLHQKYLPIKLPICLDLSFLSSIGNVIYQVKCLPFALIIKRYIEKCSLSLLYWSYFSQVHNLDFSNLPMLGSIISKHTYIIGPSVRIIDLVSHTTCVC